MGGCMFLLMEPKIKDPAKVCNRCGEIYSKVYSICSCEEPLPILQKVWLANKAAEYAANSAKANVRK
jgi:hypothetical protein